MIGVVESRGPTCAGCAELIGVYEPIFAEYDGRIIDRTSRLKLDGRPDTARLWHAACLPLESSGPDVPRVIRG